MKTTIIFFIASFLALSSLSGQWEIVNEGFGTGRLVSDFINKDTGWVAVNNTIFKTKNGGGKWTKLPVNLVSEGDNDGDIDFINDSVGWAIDGVSDIMKTLDGGQSWHRKKSGDFTKLYVVNENVVYAIENGMYSGIYKTSDGGSHWVNISPQNEGGSFWSACFLNAETCIVIGMNVINNQFTSIIFRTNDGGVKWDKKVMNEGSIINNVSFIDYTTICFLASVESSGKYFMCKTTDYFKSWSIITESKYPIGAYHFFDENNVLSIMGDSTGSNFMKSSNGGLTWEKTDAVRLPYWSYEIYFGAENIGYTVGNGGRGSNIILKSVDQGSNWTSLKMTYPFNDVCFINRDKGFIIGGHTEWHEPDVEVFTTNDKGKSWNIIFSIRSGPLLCLFTNDSNGFIGTHVTTRGGGIGSGHQLFQTLDGGDSWFECSIMNESDSYLAIQDIFLINEQIGYLATSERIYKTTDGGESWDMMWNYNTCDNTRDCKYYVRSIFFIEENTGWIAGEGGYLAKYTAWGKWEEIASGYDLPLNKVFFADSITGWIAGGYNYDGFHPILLKTENGGESWFKLENINYLIHDFYFENSQHGWAVGEDINGEGVIIATVNGGKNWAVQFDSLSAPLNAIYFKDGYGWAVGGNGLILRTTDSTYTSITEHPITDNRNNILLQNYPNPFRSNTVIGYRLSVFGSVEISVCDLIGRKITTLVNEKQPAGSYEVEWNAEGIKPGIYFCELKTGQSRKVVKMILLR